MRCEAGDLPLPDPKLHTVGCDDGGQRGIKQRKLLEHFGMRPSSAVLEIGCGLGRLAYELAPFLDEDGSYVGFDVAPEAISWLKEHYAPRLPGFQFDLLDVQNPRFRPSGSLSADKVRFPYEDSSFDVVCAFEVCMHLPLPAVVNYLSETARVLRTDGTAIVTFMAIREDDVDPAYSGLPFVPIGGGVHTRFPDRPGVSMAYDVALIHQMISEAGLDEVASIEGRWHNPWCEPAPGPVHNCDLFAARKPKPFAA